MNADTIVNWLFSVALWAFVIAADCIIWIKVVWSAQDSQHPLVFYRIGWIGTAVFVVLAAAFTILYWKYFAESLR